MINERLEREELLIGTEKLSRLREASVMVFGVGGVGGYVIEGLVRAGVGHIIAVDCDVVSMSNINRQIIADIRTVGMSKTQAAKERMMLIDPELEFICEDILVTAENAKELIQKYMPYRIVDAIDTVSAKLALICAANELGIGIVSSMGTGNKLDPERLKLADIYKTSVCPLARVMRRELKARKIKKLTVLYSDEEPVRLADGSVPIVKGDGRHAPGSISFVPSVGGLIIASKVVRDIAGL